MDGQEYEQSAGKKYHVKHLKILEPIAATYFGTISALIHNAKNWCTYFSHPVTVVCNGLCAIGRISGTKTHTYQDQDSDLLCVCFLFVFAPSRDLLPPFISRSGFCHHHQNHISLSGHIVASLSSLLFQRR